LRTYIFRSPGGTRLAFLPHAVSLCCIIVGLSSCSSETGTDPSKRTTIASFFGSPKEIAVRNAKAQNSITKCMKEAGYEYISVDNATFTSSTATPPQNEDLQWRRRNGYGMALFMEAGVSVDPNAKYQEALTSAERANYDKLLHGEEGCRQQALAPSPKARAAGERLNRKIQEFDRHLRSDPELAKLSELWSKCMKEKGYELERPGDGPVYLGAAQQTAVEKARSEGASMTRGSWLEEFRSAELHVARADADCMAPIRTAWLKAKSRLEAEFVATNRTLLEQATG
jgi:hypothetical protein